MPDIKGLLNSVADVAEKFGPLVGPAGSAGAAALDAVRDMVNRATVVAAETNEAELQAKLADALDAMNAHADRTLGSLG
jgi:threonine synthase